MFQRRRMFQMMSVQSLRKNVRKRIEKFLISFLRKISNRGTYFFSVKLPQNKEFPIAKWLKYYMRVLFKSD